MKTPYWNLWRAVLAGWLIRYPGFFFKSIVLSFLFIVLMIGLAVSPESPVEENPPIEYNTEVR